MRFDRISLALAALCLVSATVVALALLPAATTVNQAEPAPEPRDPPEDAAWTTAMCLENSDPDDPRRPGTVPGEHRTELETLAVDEPAFVDEMIAACSNFAANERDQALADQLDYVVARLHDVRQRREHYLRLLEKLAPRYPSAAYFLALDLDDKPHEVGTAEFDRVLELLRFAYKGGDLRAEQRLLAKLGELYPVEEFDFPTLFLALYRGDFATVPDTIETRMAAHSLWEGYLQRCKAWEVAPLAPADEATIKNFMIPVQVQRIKDLIQQAPTMAGAVKDWFNNVGTITLEQALRDINTATAHPSQILFVADTAAHRDGSHVYDKFTCSGVRAQTMIKHLIWFFRERETVGAVRTDPESIKVLAARPDLRKLLAD